MIYKYILYNNNGIYIYIYKYLTSPSWFVFLLRARLPGFGYSWRVGWRRWLGNGQGSPAVWILDLGMSSCEMLELKLLGCRPKKTSARLWKDIFADDVVFLTFIFFLTNSGLVSSPWYWVFSKASALRHDVSGLGLSSSGPTHRQGHPGPELHMFDSWFVWTFRWQVSIGPTMPRQAVHYPSHNTSDWVWHIVTLLLQHVVTIGVTTAWGERRQFGYDGASDEEVQKLLKNSTPREHIGLHGFTWV